MSDFIVSLDKRHSGEDLLNLIKRPYGKRAPEGRFFNFPWGSMAVLEERLADNKNVIEKDGVTFAWVGDLVTKLSNGYSERLISRILALKRGPDKDSCLQSDSVFEQLNGAFAILLASRAGFSIVPDLMGFIPIYMATDATGDIASVGTHADLVAVVSQNLFNFDMVSIAEFLNSGCCTFPYTMHSNVRELKPGRIYVVEIDENNTTVMADYLYWEPPKEILTEVDEDFLVDQLKTALLSAVRRRCKATKVGVLLSGGFDSRLVLAAVPKDTECVCLTYLNNPNRESRRASEVAKRYGRPWLPLYREPEFLASIIVDAVSLLGCEFDWFDAQNGGFVKQITELNIGCLLTGLLFDMYLKGFYAKDWIRVNRLFGILPPVYRKAESGYRDSLSQLWRDKISNNVIEKLTNREEEFYAGNLDYKRSSVAEWLTLYPFSQDPMGYWVADRKLLPLRLVATDRNLLEFAFRCPLKLKLERTIFARVVREICAQSIDIPSANDGVRAGSGHWWRLAQRAVRKLEDKTVRFLEKLGKEPKIQHSWHDYQKYWRESEKLRELIREYGANLDQFDGILFKESGQALLERKDIDWHYGFRLLQLAVWLGIIKEYGNVLKDRAR